MITNWRVAICLAILLTAMGAASAVYGAVVYVWAGSPNDGPGNDWDHACHTVPAGLAAAVSGDEVWVAKGVYVELITLKPGVALYGGFSGTETDRDQRNWRTNVTVLDGNKGGTVVTASADGPDTTRIDGFTICNGVGTSRGGGGLYYRGTSPIVITNNIVTDNSASKGGGMVCNGFGGG